MRNPVNLTECARCPRGYYRSIQDDCVACPVGRYTLPDTVAADESDCDMGRDVRFFVTCMLLRLVQLCVVSVNGSVEELLYNTDCHTM